jgi:hypothetical protein
VRGDGEVEPLNLRPAVQFWNGDRCALCGGVSVGEACLSAAGAPVAEEGECAGRIMVRMVDGTDRWGICDVPEGTGREELPLAVRFYPTFGELADAVERGDGG